jgi:DNA primase
VGIVDEDIARVRDVTDIVAIISSYTQLKRVGRRFSGLCPFHGEKSPSFSVNSEQGLYYCFGCGAKGDAITFIREKEQTDFVGAVEWLANKSGVTLRYTDANEGQDRKRRAKLHAAIETAVDWYHDRLLSSNDAGVARGYLRHRGFDGEMVRHYRLGYAPNNWDDLARHLKLSDKDLVDSGLGFVNRRSRQQDAFRDRVLFPIFDAQGKAMGFGGRILPGSDDPAKYKNSASSSVYDKSRVLYGLNWAKTPVVEADEVIVCEGYTDVIGFASAGVPRAVATCGTALTESHVKLLRRFAKRVVLAFDADAAGQNAAARFYEWERSHDLDVAVAALPDGVDPGELARTDPAALRAAVADAQPFLRFRIERALAAGNLDTVEGRARTAELALEMVSEHPDELVRDTYAMEIADRCRLKPELVRAQLANPKAAQAAPAARRRDRQGDTPEVLALTLALHQPEEINKYLMPDLFSDDLAATAFELINKCESLHDVIADGGPEVGELVQRLSVEESSAEAVDVAALLWRRYVKEAIEDTLRSARSSVSPADLATADQQHAWLRSHRDQLSVRATQVQAIESLLAWVNGQVAEESL